MGRNIESGTFRTSDGGGIAYSKASVTGSAVARVVLIHSLALDRSIWNGVVSILPADWEFLSYDCRGHGRSERRAGPFTTELFARDLAELLDHVGWQKATVAGCSMGGCVAQEFAGRYPSRTEALGLIDTTSWYGADAPKAWRERAALARAKGLTEMVQFQAARWFGDSFRQSHAELVNAAVRVFLANDLDCYASTCIMLGDADLRSHLPALRMPVAVIVGEEDQATPVEVSRNLHAAIQGSTLTIIAGGRHLTPMECPDQIAEQLRLLVQRISR